MMMIGMMAKSDHDHDQKTNGIMVMMILIMVMGNLSDSGSDSVIPVFAVWKLIKGAQRA